MRIFISDTFEAEMFQSILIWDEDGPRPVLVLISSSNRPRLVLTSSSSRPRPQN